MKRIVTHDDWLACDSPGPMLTFLRGKKGSRKNRLLACACCRFIWDRIQPRYQRAVEMSEAFADGLVPRDELEKSLEEASVHRLHLEPHQAAYWACDPNSPSAMADGVVRNLFQARLDKRISTQVADLLRDMFQPFRPRKRGKAAPFPSSDTVLNMANAIYAERAFDRLPILADALEEAGCTDADVLAHCRGPGPHVRGCWVVDLILGKE
jgi:hypothetical protein